MIPINSQPIEKRDDTRDGTVDVHSIFFTIQGEGPFCGTPAVFIRLAGCNLQCPQCDTEYTRPRTRQSVQHIVDVVQLHMAAPGLVVITGGEPFRQRLSALIDTLLSFHYYVQVETNGTLRPDFEHWTRDIDARYGAYMVVSPKTGKVHPFNTLMSCCYKYVMDADSVAPDDGLPMRALGHTATPRLARPHVGKRIYLQPADHQDLVANKRNLEACIKSCLKHNYILQLQTHKLIGMP